MADDKVGQGAAFLAGSLHQNAVKRWMELHDIGLGRTSKLSGDTAEVVAAEGGEIVMPMVEEHHD
jgi:hypothetical protein